LLKFWQERINRVTNETFLSGKGIARIFDFYVSHSHTAVSAQMLASMKHDDPAAVINLYATKYKEPLALKTMQCFADIYASVAGDMALACKATGGVYLTGGISPQALPFLQSDRFVQRFNNKPPMQALMATMPVQVVLNTSVGLLGAMKLAIRMSR
jgi:glucokinase